MLLLAVASSGAQPQPIAIPAAPRIASIEFYGHRKVDLKDLQKALGLKVGDPLPGSKGEVEDRLNGVGNVVESHISAVCCEGKGVILYVGIEERGATHFEVRSPPEGPVLLPEEVYTAYTRYLTLLQEAVQKGQAGDNLSEGHSLIEYAPARALQLEFIRLAETYLAALRNVLKNSSDEDHRAAAAAILGYANDKRRVLPDLQAAMKDPASTVRNNAMRALTAFAVLGERDPESGIRVSPTWFIEMLNSLAWTDRNKSSLALVTLTEKRDPAAMEQLRDRALESLAEMARWRNPSHAFAPFVLLGRAAGAREEEIRSAWTAPDREPFLAKAYRDARKLRDEWRRRNTPGRTTP